MSRVSDPAVPADPGVPEKCVHERSRARAIDQDRRGRTVVLSIGAKDAQFGNPGRAPRNMGRRRPHVAKHQFARATAGHPATLQTMVPGDIA